MTEMLEMPRKLIVLVLMLVMAVSVVYGQDKPVTTRDSAADGANYQLTEVVNGLKEPLLAIGAGDCSGRLFIVQQTGQILIWAGGQLQSTPFLDGSTTISTDSSERGLLGL